MIGEVVDGHEIIRPLGAGGMGQVYLGQGAGGSLRAFKVVRADREASHQAAGRFKREVLALGKLHHPGIIQILDAGRLPGGALYLGMEYVAGPDLQAAVGWDGAFGVREGLTILVQLAAALAYAHEEGIVHRDLKPSNVILADGDPGRAKIIDFGLAKLASEEGLTRLTEDQQVLGSPLYWAPEQTTSAAVGPAADIYALGGLAYFVLTGEPMFRPRPTVAMVYAHVHEQPEPLAQRCAAALPPGLEELVAACVAKSPAARPYAERLVVELDRLLAAVPAGAAPVRSQRLFTRTGVSNLGQALTAQIRQVLLELAAVMARPVDHIEQIQHELSELELDLAMLDSEVEATIDPAAEQQRAGVATTVAELESALADAYRELLEAVDADRRRAPPDAAPLFTELDALIAQYRTL